MFEVNVKNGMEAAAAAAGDQLGFGALIWG